MAKFLMNYQCMCSVYRFVLLCDLFIDLYDILKITFFLDVYYRVPEKGISLFSGFFMVISMLHRISFVKVS